MDGVVVTLDRWRRDRDSLSHRWASWWPWAVLVAGIFVIVIGGVLFTPGT